MSDPRTVGPQQRAANMSELMRAKGKASLGEKVNFCPFGCTVEDLDDHGYCDHLVGVTEDGKTMEQMVTDERGRRRTLGTLPAPVPKGAKLVRITTCARVYADAKTEKQKA